MLMLDEHGLLPNGLVLQAIVPEEHPNSLVLKSIATYLSARVEQCIYPYYRPIAPTVTLSYR